MIDLYGPGYPVRPNHPDSRVRGDRWLQAVLASDLTPGAKVIAAAIVRIHFNWTTGQCNPSQDTIALETRQCSRSVEKQLEKLRGAGFLAWRKGFQTSNRYWLLLTPNAGRELGEGDQASTPNAGRELKTELSAGIEASQYRTVGRPIPNPRGRQNRTLGGRNPCLTPEENPSSAAPPRAPDGAAGAASWGETEQRLRARTGDKFDLWLGGGKSILRTGAPAVIVLRNPHQASNLRRVLGKDLDAVFPDGWQIADQLVAA